VSNATINRELSLLSAAINFYNKEHMEALPNPTKGRKLREPEARIRWLSQGEADRLIEAARRSPRAGHLADFILLALHTGCRSGELLGLQWSRVDMQQRLIRLEGGGAHQGG
jgi:integrase